MPPTGRISTWSAAQWPNVLELTVSGGNLQFAANDPIPVSYHYQDYGSIATMSFSLDPDRNPYNQNSLVRAQFDVQKTGSAPVLSDDSLSTSGVASGTYYVTARISDPSGLTRYAYAPDPVTIVGAVDNKPDVALTAPSEGATVSGKVIVTAVASDDHGVAKVEFFAAGTKIGEDTDPANGWSASWDTTATLNGLSVVTATATDTIGQTASDIHNVTVNNVVTSTMHVGDLDGTAATVRKGWKATVTITVHDQNNQALPNATVQGTWSGGYAGVVTVTTGSNGQAVMSTGNISAKKNSVTFTVNNIARAGFTYSPNNNHDIDGESNGTTITILRPGASAKTAAKGAADSLEAMYTDAALTNMYYEPLKKSRIDTLRPSVSRNVESRTRDLSYTVGTAPSYLTGDNRWTTDHDSQADADDLFAERESDPLELVSVSGLGI